MRPSRPLLGWSYYLWIFVRYLFYGLSFFTLGIAILSRDISLSELGIAPILWLLAGFRIVHGFHELLELLELLFPEVGRENFLLYFGIFLNILTIGGEQALRNTSGTIKVVVGMAVLTLALIAAGFCMIIYSLLVLLVEHGEMRFMDITRSLGIADHTKVGFHLKNLKAMAMIDQSREKSYRLTPHGKKSTTVYIFWPNRFLH